MLSFKESLNEDTNTHLEHLEDEIINGGVAGAKTAILFLKSLKDMLSGSGKSKTVITQVYLTQTKTHFKFMYIYRIFN